MSAPAARAPMKAGPRQPPRHRYWASADVDVASVAAVIVAAAARAVRAFLMTSPHRDQRATVSVALPPCSNRGNERSAKPDARLLRSFDLVEHQCCGNRADRANGAGW